MNKMEWLYKLRRIQQIDTLEKVIDWNNRKLTGTELIEFYSAADHRLAELITGKLFDKVPAAVWRLAR